jgi:hypothetical protein
MDLERQAASVKDFPVSAYFWQDCKTKWLQKM